MRTDYIHSVPGSVNLYYIRDIPKNVRHLLPLTKSGKQPTKWKISLGTAVRREAAPKARKLAAEHDAFIEGGKPPHALASLSDAEREAIDDAGGVQGYLKWLNDRAGEAVRLADEAESWRDFAADERSPAEAPDPDWIASKTAALDAERHQIERQLARDVPTVKALGHTPKKLVDMRLSYVADAVAQNRRDPATLTLNGVVKAWKENLNPVAPEQYEYPVKLFEELCGALPVRKITVDHVRDFRYALTRMPPASGGKFENKTMPEILRLAARNGLKPLKDSTAGKHFRCLQGLFAFAFDERYIDLNIAAGIKWRSPKTKHSEAKKILRRTFSPVEMATLYDAAKISKWHDATENLWFLRLMTYTGARPEELAQLAPGDVIKIGGHLCLNVHDLGENHAKNPSSIRPVPVHPELLALGFEDFVKTAHNQPYLFLSLRRDSRDRLYGRMGGRLSRLIDGKVSNDPRLVPYSLRHGFKDALRLVPGYDREVAEMIMGHSNPRHRTGRGYGAEQVVIMAELIAKADPFDKRRVVSEFEDEEIVPIDDVGRSDA